MSPIAIGILVVPIERLSQKVATPGMIAPKATPSPIAKKIHSVSQRSKKESFFVPGAFIKINPSKKY
jgi:hypothetical protein